MLGVQKATSRLKLRNWKHNDGDQDKYYIWNQYE
jgi:hypothetical protein